MGIKLKKWDVVDHLKDEEAMVLYLEACFEEDPGDGSLIRAALGDIARARGMAQLARDTGLSREGLYKALSPEGNPEFSTVVKVINGLGLKLNAAHPGPVQVMRSLIPSKELKMAKNTKQSGTKVTHQAAKTLANPNASATAKSLAASVVSQAHTGKETGKAMETKASKALQSGTSSKATKSLAGSVLSQSNKKR